MQELDLFSGPIYDEYSETQDQIARKIEAELEAKGNPKIYFLGQTTSSEISVLTTQITGIHTPCKYSYVWKNPLISCHKIVELMYRLNKRIAAIEMYGHEKTCIYFRSQEMSQEMIEKLARNMPDYRGMKPDELKTALLDEITPIFVEEFKIERETERLCHLKKYHKVTGDFLETRCMISLLDSERRVLVRFSNKIAKGYGPNVLYGIQPEAKP